MSHSVTVTRTTTTTTTSAILVNTGFLKTVPGLLKLLETILGGVCLGLLCHYYTQTRVNSEYLYILLMTPTFFIATALNLLACILSISTATLLPKTMFELIYHAVAFILLTPAGIAMLVELDRHRNYYYYEPLMAAAVIALINGILYLVSTVFSYRSYKGV